LGLWYRYFKREYLAEFSASATGMFDPDPLEAALLPDDWSGSSTTSTCGLRGELRGVAMAQAKIWKATVQPVGGISFEATVQAPDGNSAKRFFEQQFAPVQWVSPPTEVSQQQVQLPPALSAGAVKILVALKPSRWSWLCSRTSSSP
jgi:hypothetical protein